MTVATIGGGNLPDQIQFAKALADSSLLPKAYARQPANVLLAIQMGEALGIPAVQAINSIHVIEGKPSASADLIASLVRRAGHKLRIREEATQDGPRVTATLIRHDDPDFTFEAAWDMAKARAANLTGKAVWKQYPGQMLRSRAITEVCRQGAGDALFGVAYTSEELGGEDRPGTRVEQAPKQAPPTADEIMAAAPPPEPEADPDTGEVEMITDAQTRKMGAQMRDLGITDRADALAFVSEEIGREVKSRSELTKTEASKVIDSLEQLIAAQPVDAEVVEP